MERELIECFEKWIGQEMEDSCYEGEVIEGYHIKFYPEWSLPPHITLEMDMIDLSDAVRLSPDEWDRLKVIVDFVDSSGDWMRLSFDDFMRYAAERGLVRRTYPFYVLGDDAYYAMKKYLTELFSDESLHLEEKEVYFAVETLTRKIKRPEFTECWGEIDSILSQIDDVIMSNYSPLAGKFPGFSDDVRRQVRNYYKNHLRVYDYDIISRKFTERVASE